MAAVLNCDLANLVHLRRARGIRLRRGEHVGRSRAPAEGLALVEAKLVVIHAEQRAVGAVVLHVELHLAVRRDERHGVAANLFVRGVDTHRRAVHVGAGRGDVRGDSADVEHVVDLLADAVRADELKLACGARATSHLVLAASETCHDKSRSQSAESSTVR